MFCTNCGSEVAEKAVACPKCGCPPRKEKKYCYNCGTEVKSTQVMCVKCGVSLGSASQSAGQGERKRTAAGLFAIFLGSFGAHKFYNGSWGWGIVYLVAGLVTFFMVSGIAGLVEGIIYLTKDEDWYDETYNQTPSSPFKW